MQEPFGTIDAARFRFAKRHGQMASGWSFQAPGLHSTMVSREQRYRDGIVHTYDGSWRALGRRVSEMTSSEVQITNLLYRYAEYIDSGDFNAAAGLFVHAKTKFADRIIETAEVLAIWRSISSGIPTERRAPSM